MIKFGLFAVGNWLFQINAFTIIAIVCQELMANSQVVIAVYQTKIRMV
jgi:hypothetical protein